MRELRGFWNLNHEWTGMNTNEHEWMGELRGMCDLRGFWVGLKSAVRLEYGSLASLDP